MKAKAPPRNLLVRIWDRFWFARHFTFTVDAPPNVAAEMIRRIPIAHPGMLITMGNIENNACRFRIDNIGNAMIIGRIYRDEDQTFIEGKAQFEIFYPMAVWLAYPLTCIFSFMFLVPLYALKLVDGAKLPWLALLILPVLVCLAVLAWFRRQRERFILRLIEAVRDMEVIHGQWETHGRAILSPRDLPEAPYAAPVEPEYRKKKP